MTHAAVAIRHTTSLKLLDLRYKNHSVTASHVVSKSYSNYFDYDVLATHPRNALQELRGLNYVSLSAARWWWPTGNLEWKVRIGCGAGGVGPASI